MANSSVQRAIKFSVDRLGYETLKAEQEMAVWELLGSKDVFVALATGYSKLLCYACFPDVIIKANCIFVGN